MMSLEHATVRLRSRKPLAALVVLALCVGCSSPSTIRIGKKAFAEQDVLAEILALVIEDKTVHRAQIVPCADTFGCQQALRSGQVDLMVEYTGTGYFYSGIELGEQPVSIAALRDAYRPMGLEWLEPIGFENSYVVAMPSSRSNASGIRSITSLSGLSGGAIRIACPATYLQRPRDGLASLLDRHGLRLLGDAIVIADPADRLDATRDGRADVAIVYATDGVLTSHEYVALDDSLGFFPPYEAAVLARVEALEKHAGLRDALGAVIGTIDNPAMQRLNYGVEVEGWQARVLAQRHLRETGVVREQSAPAAGVRPVIIASAHSDRFDEEKSRAARATNVVFSERPVELVDVVDPIAAVVSGDARLALIGAERFFYFEGEELKRDRRIEAVAVVGTRVFHVLRRSGETGWALSGRVGVGVSGSGAADAATALLSVLGLDADVYTPDATLVELVATGKLDVGLVFARPGDAIVADALSSGSLELRPLPEINRRDRVPYLRQARLPAQTYSGQESAVQTLSAQVLLAGPARSNTHTPLATGPVAAFGRKAPPLGLEEATSLSKASGIAETPDPILPSAWTSWPDATDPELDDDHRIADTILNLVVLAFLAWVFVLIVQRDPSDDGKTKDPRR